MNKQNVTMRLAGLLMVVMTLLVGCKHLNSELAESGKASGGGDVVVVADPDRRGNVMQLYSLDLVEWGLEKNQNVTDVEGWDELAQKIRDVSPPLFLWTDTESLMLMHLSGRLLRIKKVEPKFYDLLVGQLFSDKITWTLVNAPLREIEDENSGLGRVLQMARNDRVICLDPAESGCRHIKISAFGWEKSTIIDGYNAKMGGFHKSALILHELLYQITMLNGDHNSDRARRANALIHARDGFDESVKTAYKLVTTLNVKLEIQLNEGKALYNSPGGELVKRMEKHAVVQMIDEYAHRNGRVYFRFHNPETEEFYWVNKDDAVVMPHDWRQLRVNSATYNGRLGKYRLPGLTRDGEMLKYTKFSYLGPEREKNGKTYYLVVIHDTAETAWIL